MTDQELLTLAEEYGFDCAAPMDATKLEVLQDVRDACVANRCGQYNKTWACPPAFGDLEESRRILAKYKRGLLVQSVQTLEDDFDWEGIQELGKRHGENFGRLYQRLREVWPDLREAVKTARSAPTRIIPAASPTKWFIRWRDSVCS